ncbi:PEGA domain-containing protein [Polyangium spumosum]|nr:PEGA domain-containing protein [Polyangium spumosum]
MMKLASALFFALALVPGAALAEVTRAEPAAKPDAAPPKGFVTVACNPGCEGVLVDGRSLGPSPVVRAELPAGTHKLTLRRKGYPEKKVDVVVKAGATALVDVKLVQQAAPPKEPPSDIAARVAARKIKADGFLSVVCDPACDQVIVDGKRKLGPAPHTNVSFPGGQHEIRIQRKGAPDKVMVVNLVPGQTTAFRVAMHTEAERAVVPAKASAEPKAKPKR